MRTHEFPWIWISTPWIIMTMNMTMKWISKSMNLYEYEYDVHEPYDYEKVHEYDTYDYESLWAVWTKIVNSMNLYEYEYETSWIWTIWLWITMNSMNQILSDAWVFMSMVDRMFFLVIFGLRGWVISKVLKMRNGDHKTKSRLLSSLKKLLGE